ncbi:hypothetical protein DSM25558_0198 [Agrobacterium sp. DSM 25558]|uniref:hypothetical protein n=1 Tax=Agrobacterium sp. DSM 25558 TaxID=1907665 RepID=UPI000972405B|nr:hypothetical protein [Agrobacterium sp. DSM 25558]SCX00920.1 hypothetical protein DSM25558_0198 [Agrobacterium sp. DSM 25558]
MVKPRENRVPIMMSEEELRAIDDWRFENRIATRSDAVRRLVQIALRFERQFDSLHSEARALTEFVPQTIDQLNKDMNQPDKEAWDASVGLQVLIALLNQSEGQKRLLSILFGVLGESATLKDEQATASAIARTDEAAEEYYKSIDELLSPLVNKWEDQK